MTIILEDLIPEFKKHIAIIANGEFPSSQKVLNWLQFNQLMIACDGALINLKQQDLIADFAIGDGDSSNLLSDLPVKNPFIQIKDQNSNDLSKAVNWIAENYGTETPIIIYAANGQREDHALANIALLQQYAERFSRIIILSDYGIWLPLSVGTNYIHSQPGQQISFFSLNSQLQLSCAQLKWPLKNFHFEFLNSGTLNEATGTQLKITVTHPGLVYLAFEIKIPSSR